MGACRIDIAESLRPPHVNMKTIGRHTLNRHYRSHVFGQTQPCYIIDHIQTNALHVCVWSTHNPGTQTHTG